jgi:transcriptional regulator with XRE-family HTH domain
MSSILGCLDATRRGGVIHKMAPVVIDSQLDARRSAAHAPEAIAAKAPRMVIPTSAATCAANGIFASDAAMTIICNGKVDNARLARRAANPPFVENEEFGKKSTRRWGRLRHDSSGRWRWYHRAPPSVSPTTVSCFLGTTEHGILSIVIKVATTRLVLMRVQATFAATLRWWREHRGLSQLALAYRANVSQRHLSFLELGRAAPSRTMVTRLATALEVPLRQHNGLLLAAGYVPAWRQTQLAAPELAQVTSALDFILTQQEPFPAVVVDRQWTLLRSNQGAVRLVEFLVGPLAPDTPINLADALVAPNILKPYLENWADVVRYFIRSAEADAAADGATATAALLERLTAYQGVRAAMKQAMPDVSAGPVLPMHFRKGGTSLQLFTTITTLGTPQDITLQELRIECFFPMNDETARCFRSWSAKAKSPRSQRPTTRSQ